MATKTHKSVKKVFNRRQLIILLIKRKYIVVSSLRYLAAGMRLI
ncbi:hypothetical protein ATN83_3162 [Raoultella ornithinolytica]|nr:hypothetical protein ATN83_3162 [Raoultella ornithinolytica]KDV93660.1 hypothetical protein AB00_1804 [Raoultella ornithinolytica 2-156-04_S1_C1]KDX13893.1 hypothetical protein AB28_1996 [Raoultella ornithinolytica 2-156-04_S1_C2]